MLNLITKAASAAFIVALMLPSEANAESRLPPCPTDTNVILTGCYGTRTWPDGGIYVGEWKDDRPNGRGTYTLPDLLKYVGEWKDGDFNGQGTFTALDGIKYVGEFKDGAENGQGTFTESDGIKYVGEFKDGVENGHGTLYSSNGSVIQSGVWKDNALVEPSAENSSNETTAAASSNLHLIIVYLLIAGGIGIVALFLLRDRTEPSRRFSSPIAAAKVPVTKLEGAQRRQETEQGQQSSPTSVPPSERIEALERLSRLRENGILSDVEVEQEKKRVLVD
jgi:hypothetical protein